MRGIQKSVILLLLVSSCIDVKKDEEMKGIDLFKLKVKNIQHGGEYKVGDLEYNDFSISYNANECVNAHFSWKKGELKLSSVQLFIHVNQRAFECVFDKSEFGDIVSNNNPFGDNDTIVDKCINLRTARYRLLGSKFIFNADVFFSELSKCDTLAFRATMYDVFITKNPSYFTMVRRSNFIDVILSD